MCISSGLVGTKQLICVRCWPFSCRFVSSHAGSGQPGALPEDEQARAALPNLFADPLGFWHFLLFVVPVRIWGSLSRMALWVWGTPIQNNNHAFVNYAQVR